MSLIEEAIRGYEEFKKRVEELKATQSKLVVLFTGSKVDGRTSWCPDCNDLEDVLKSFKLKYKPTGYLLTVDVGNRDEWKNKDNNFRTDPAVKISSIPTIVLWGTPRRLSNEAILDEENLQMLFSDDD